MNKICKFDGDYAFLSNFYICPISYKGRIFTSSEAAFQAEKCLMDNDKDLFINLAPGKAKRLGRKILLRPDWEKIREKIMFDIVLAKFNQNSDLAEKLLMTDNTYLIEGNYWKDQFWGVYPEDGSPGIDGLNVLGQILMRIRADLRYQKERGAINAN